ncbi:MAG: hypothetical protein Q4A00_04115 [Flavobacteriaceae bacterium]|nr:hypothetical protein [Flavobacteriaceae bacterium]
MKLFLGIIIVFCIFYFVWQWIKRKIYIKIFKTLSGFSPNEKAKNPTQNPQSTKSQRKFKKDINWDAETVEFEEVPENRGQSK